MRRSGLRHWNARNRSPENFVSAMNTGKPGDHEDRNGPRREVQQQSRVAQDRDAVLRERERAVHEAQGPHGRLLARAIQLVVELRVLELRERERERLVENQQVHALRQQHAQQRLAEIDAALRARDCRDERALERDERQHARDVGLRAGPIRVDRRDDRIDDQLADIRDPGRRQTGREREQRERDREPAVRRPHERERPPPVPPNPPPPLEGAIRGARSQMGGGGAL